MGVIAISRILCSTESNGSGKRSCLHFKEDIQGSSSGILVSLALFSQKALKLALFFTLPISSKTISWSLTSLQIVSENLRKILHDI